MITEIFPSLFLLYAQLKQTTQYKFHNNNVKSIDVTPRTTDFNSYTSSTNLTDTIDSGRHV